MYQILQHVLPNPENKTKFTLLFGNIEERDILLREDFEALAKKYPNNFKVVHVLGTAPESWKGTSTYHYSGMPLYQHARLLRCEGFYHL